MRPVPTTAVLVLLAGALLASPARAQDGETDRMERVIQEMQQVKNRSTQQVGGAYARAVEPIEYRAPRPEPTPQARPSWLARHKWKLAGAVAVLLCGWLFLKMERAWRRS